MLKITPVKNAGQASHYFFEQDNYYLKDSLESRELTQWSGKGAVALGLKGEIDSVQFEKLLQGKLPTGQQMGKKVGEAVVHRPGFDVTFSAPKSVSLLCCTGIDPRLEQAHHEAVQKTLSVLEQDCAQARYKVDGQIRFENTRNLVIAQFPHDTSRDMDPQKHTHCIVLNMTQRKDGAWRALASQSPSEKFKTGDSVNGFYERVTVNQTYYGMLYRAELAHNITQLGYKIRYRDREKGFFELDLPGLTDERLAKFSKRREVIEAELEKHGWEGGKAAAFAALSTRKAKQGMDRATLRAEWIGEAKRVGVDLTLFRPNLDPDSKTQPPPVEQALSIQNHAEQTVDRAIAHHETFEVLLNHEQLVQTALRFSLGELPAHALLSALEGKVAKGALLPILDDKKNSGYMSKAMVEREQDILKSIQSGKDLGSLQDRTHAALESAVPMYRDYVAKVLQSVDRITALSVSDVHDKRIFLQSFLSVLERSGQCVRIITPTQTQAQWAQKNTHRSSDTLWQWLVNLGRPELGETFFAFEKHYRKDLAQPLGRWFHRNDYLIVDKADRMGNIELQKLLALSVQSGARVLLIGDEKAKGALTAGNPWQKLITQHANLIRLERPISENASSVTSIVEAKGISDLVKHYVDLAPAERLKTAVLASSQAQASAFNHAIRDALKEKGELREEQYVETLQRVGLTEAQKSLANQYQVGQRILSHRDYASLSLKRGGWATIEAIYPKRNLIVLKTDAEKTCLWDPGKTHQALEALQPILLPIASGDRIQLTRAVKDPKLSQGAFLTVVQVMDKTLEALDERGKLHALSLDKTEHQFFQQGYAQSISSLSDQTYDCVLSFLTPRQATQRRLHELARVTPHLTVFTDSVEELQSRIEKGDRGKQCALQVQADPAHVPSHSAPSRVESAVSHALEKLTERDAGFRHKDLVNAALQYGLGNVSFEQVNQEILNRRKTGEIVLGKGFQDGSLWTTQAAIELEKAIFEKAGSGRGQVEPILGQTVVETKLKDSGLTEGQKAACQLIMTSPDRLVLVQGYAGTGKTTLLKQVQSLSQEQGYTLLTLAPTHQAVQELKKVGMPSQTLDSFLMEAAKELKTEKITDRQKTLIVLDEASMVSNQKFLDFQIYLEKSGARGAPLGDQAQLLAIESGKPFSLLQSKTSGLKTAVMKDIIRQKTPALREAVYSTLDKSYQTAFDKIASLNPEDFIQREPGYEGKFTQSIVSLSQEEAVRQLVQDYLTRVPEAQAKTLILAHTHADREKINALLREGLKERGKIEASTEQTFTVLKNRGLTLAELKDVRQYQPTDVLRFNRASSPLGIPKDSYWQIQEIDTQRSLLILNPVEPADLQPKNVVFELERSSLLKSRGSVEVYEPDTRKLALGDRFRFTRTDRDRQIASQTEGKVVALSEKSIWIETQDKTHQINPLNQAEQHWDHAYSATGYGLQGATDKYLIDYEISHRKHLTNQRSFYVAVSRAQWQVTIYTDDKDKLLQKLYQTTGDKYSALEITGEFKKRGQKNTEAETKAVRLEADVVLEKLTHQSESVIERLLGNPHPTLSTAKSWRYGKKGSLAIDPQKGLWHSFETSESGNLLQLIQKERGLSFKEALTVGANWVGLETSAVSEDRPVSQKQDTAIKEKKSKAISAYVKQLAEESQPIQGTLAEQYLKEFRGIDKVESQDVRFHPRVPSQLNRGTFPALLVLARNETGEVQSVQATFLNPETAQKADVPVKKQTFGSVKGAQVEVSGKSLLKEVSLIAEGTETGLSVSRAFPDCQTLVTLGKSNFAHVEGERLQKNVVFCLDNDGNPAKTLQEVTPVAERLASQGKQVWMAMPSEAKTDFNDLHLKKGLLSVRERVLDAFSFSGLKESEPLTLHLRQQMTLEKEVKAPTSASLERAIQQVAQENKKLPSLEDKGLENGFTRGRVPLIERSPSVDKGNRERS